MHYRSLRWKAVASLAATAAFLGIAAAFRGLDERALPLAPAASALPQLRLAEPRVETSSAESRLGTVVLRAAPNLAGNADPAALVERLRRQGAHRVWIQCKQDETDEVTDGEVFFPSALAPVAAGFEDGRLWRFVDMLRDAKIEVAAWMPAFHDPQAAAHHPDWRAHKLNAEGAPEPQAD